MDEQLMRQQMLNLRLAQRIGLLEMELIAAQVEIDELRQKEAARNAPEPQRAE